jgi:uncharacterized protein (TIGR00730 family)
MADQPRAIAVYCGSSAGHGEAYRLAARQLGAAIARRGYTLVYGGARIGLMGEVADAALAAGGAVTGIIPRWLVDRELVHEGLTTVEVVDTMHTRKARMAELADAFVALPGGFGTMDELFEVLTWNQIGLHSKPCGLLNAENYYDHLISFIDHTIAQGFIPAQHRSLIAASPDADTLLDLIASAPAPRAKWEL